MFPTKLNLLAQMRATLTVQQLALLRDVSNLAVANGVGLYIVGGFVRDLVLGGAGREVDLVVEGDAIGLAQVVAAQCGGRVTPHRRFGTAKWRLPPDLGTACGWSGLDFVMARSEVYARPAALPAVTRAAIREDMQRRDFTINTLALCLDGERAGEVLDFYAGRVDLDERLIRVLHPRSFEDDPTRMFRAVRFAVRLNCALEPATRQLIAPAHAHIAALSSERLRRELQLVFEERRAAEILIQLNDLGLLSAIHPVLANTADAWLADKLAVAETGAEAADVSWLLWLYRVPADAALAVAQRLRLPVRLTAALRQAQQLGADPGLRRELKASALVALLAGIHDSALAVLDIAAQDEGVRHNVRRYRSELRYIKPLVTGKVLRARGLAAGPQYTKVLGRLRDAWLDGEICDAAGELALLDFFLSQS